MGVESTEKWAVPHATNQFGQETELIEDDFDEIEGVFWSEFLRDKNSGVDNPLIEGDVMRSHSMMTELEYSGTGFVKLFSVGFKWFISQLTNK